MLLGSDRSGVWRGVFLAKYLMDWAVCLSEGIAWTEDAVTIVGGESVYCSL